MSNPSVEVDLSATGAVPLMRGPVWRSGRNPVFYLHAGLKCLFLKGPSEYEIPLRSFDNLVVGGSGLGAVVSEPNALLVLLRPEASSSDPIDMAIAVVRWKTRVLRTIEKFCQSSCMHWYDVRQLPEAESLPSISSASLCELFLSDYARQVN